MIEWHLEITTGVTLENQKEQKDRQIPLKELQRLNNFLEEQERKQKPEITAQID